MHGWEKKGASPGGGVSAARAGAVGARASAHAVRRVADGLKPLDELGLAALQTEPAPGP